MRYFDENVTFWMEIQRFRLKWSILLEMHKYYAFTKITHAQKSRGLLRPWIFAPVDFCAVDFCARGFLLRRRFLLPWIFAPGLSTLQKLDPSKMTQLESTVTFVWGTFDLSNSVIGTRHDR